MDLVVERLGDRSKASIIMLHGWGLNSSYMRELANYLADNFDVHLVNLPGFGGSPVPPSPYGLAEMSRDVVSYAKSAGVTNPIFIGHSVGGKISAYTAATDPSQVSKLILINSSGLVRQRDLKTQVKIKSIQYLRTTIKWIDKKFDRSYFQDWFIPRFAAPDYKNAGPMLPTFLKIVNEHLTDLLPRITCKTLLLWGSEDAETPLEVGERFHRAIPNSELVVLTGAGHLMFSGSGAAQCAFQIRKFLQC